MSSRFWMPLAVALVAVGVTACGGEPRAEGVGARAGNGASALRVIYVRTPRLRVRRYLTRGTWPQLASRGRQPRQANAALFEVLHDDQRTFAKIARKQLRQPYSLWRRFTGTYETRPRRGLISASTVVVSALVAQRQLFPGGNDGDRWLSVTVRVSNGSRIVITDLFARPADGLRVLAETVRKQLQATNPCVRKSRSPFTLRGFAPTATHYRHFALTPSGLAVGFNLGDVAEVPCGRVVSVVPYSSVRPHLGKLGQELVAGVRRPRD
jgi:uncharacterized protein DUF3298